MGEMLQVTKGLAVPLKQAASQVYALFARRGAGKSNAAAVLIEALLGQSVQVIILDPAQGGSE